MKYIFEAIGYLFGAGILMLIAAYVIAIAMIPIAVLAWLILQITFWMQ